jgi:serine/threonine protein kinase
LLKEAKQVGNTFQNCDSKPDIYSFGILLWELYTNTIPFNVKISTLYDYVVIENYRPEITKNFNQDIANLIRLCWDAEPMKRPNFKTIIELINKAKIY